MRTISFVQNFSLVLAFLLIFSGTNISPAISFNLPITEDNAWTQHVNSTRMFADIQTLASDQYKGRYPGTEGEELTLEYINNQLMKLDVSILTDRNDFKQPFPIKHWTMPIAPINVTINGKTLILNKDYVELSYTGNSSILTPTEIVFVGYGITTANYDDYKDIDITDKIVLVCRGVPEGLGLRREYGYFGVKAKTAFSNGAGGFIVVVHPNTKTDKFIKGTITPDNFIPEMGSISANRSVLDQLGLNVTQRINELDSFLSGKTSYSGSKSRATGIFATFEVTTLYQRNVEAANIIAKYRGSSEDTIIVSAHHDHIGETPLGEIFYGADDDASGCAVTLEVARVLNELLKQYRFRKNIIIALWGAEEIGLIGSRYYANNPLIPLRQINLVLQLDMVGIGPIDGYLQVNGGQYLPSAMLEDIRRAAQKYGNINSIEVGDVSSDHLAFLERNVRAVNFFWDALENHPNIHTTQDTADLINPEILEKVALTTLGYIIEFQELLEDLPETSELITVSQQLVITSLLLIGVIWNQRKNSKKIN